MRATAADLRTRLDRLDVLVNNAAVTLRSPSRTSEGHDEMLAINHLGPFLLTNELRPLLESSAPARVVNVASNAHKMAKHVDFEHLDSPTGYGVLGFGRYGETKLMNILWTRELARRLDGTGITANALHPGGVRTNLGNPPKPVIAVVGLFLVSPEKGAATSLYLATDPAVEGITGAYWAKSRRADGKLSSAARDDDAGATPLGCQRGPRRGSLGSRRMAEDPRSWWRNGVLYQVYPRSYADSNGDGVGDLAGITAHLDHLQWLGVKGFWSSPITPSSNYDWGYDVTTSPASTPNSARSTDAEDMIRAAHDRGLKVILDLMPNHTSVEHPWFIESRSFTRQPETRLVRVGRRLGRRLDAQQLAEHVHGPGVALRQLTGQYYMANFLEASN